MEENSFDLDQTIDRAWSDFTGRLAEVVSMMDDAAELRLDVPTAEGTAPAVRFAAVPGSRVPGEPEIELTADLGDLDAMARALADERLVAAGWQVDPVGARTVAAQVQAPALAALAVSALREVYGVQHPVFLAPDQLADVLQPGEGPDPDARSTALAGLSDADLRATMPGSLGQLRALVAAELTALIGFPPLSDPEGDWAIRVGTTMVFVRVSPDTAEVVLFAPLVHDVEGRSRAAEVVNDLNVDARIAKFSVHRDRVYVSISVFSMPFVPLHLRQAMQMIGQIADGIDEELAMKLRGRTTFSPDEGPGEPG